MMQMETMCEASCQQGIVPLTGGNGHLKCMGRVMLGTQQLMNRHDDTCHVGQCHMKSIVFVPRVSDDGQHNRSLSWPTGEAPTGVSPLPIGV